VPLRRLLTLDLSDRRLDLNLGVPELPLLYGFHYDATVLAYEAGPGGIQVLVQEKTRPLRGFPYENYPDRFPEVPCSLRKRALPGREGTREERRARLADLPQGAPRTPCPRPGCPGRLRLLSVVDPDPVGGTPVWDAIGMDEDVKIVHQICARCECIRASNQCT
jgi:hypothetical protein